MRDSTALATDPLDGLSDYKLLEMHQDDLMAMFDELSFSEKWRRVRVGLRLPRNSGAHKWAMLQIRRLLSPVAAVVVPLLILVVISFFSTIKSEPVRDFTVQIVTPVKDDILDEKIEMPVIERTPQPDPVISDIITPDIKFEEVESIAPPNQNELPSIHRSVEMTKCPVIMKSVYTDRSPGARRSVLAAYGALETDDAVMRALRYLKQSQHSDGSWGKNRIAMTSLAVLAYLAHDELPSSEEFGKTVQHAIQYILKQQKPDGHFVGSDAHDYTLPIATYALAEAYAMIKNPRLKQPIINSVKLIIAGQNRNGGYDYNLKQSERCDTSYMGWCVQALKSAKLAGLASQLPGLDKCMQNLVLGFSHNYSVNQAGYGQFGYAGKGGRGGLTGCGALCLQFLHAINTRQYKGAIKGLSDWAFDWTNPERYGPSFIYYMYYTTQAKFQQGGSDWKRWDKPFSTTLMREQRIVAKEKSGYCDHQGMARAIGSWTSPSPHEHNGGNPVMDTVLCTLMLEVYYRNLATYQKLPEGDDDTIGDEDDPVIFFTNNKQEKWSSCYAAE